MLTRDDATEAAGKIMDMLAPVCERIEVAGSIRRREPMVKDIEIICQPVPSRSDSLFSEWVRPPDDSPTVVDKLVARLCAGPGPLQFDSQLKRNGSRYKRLDWDGRAKVDLFIVLPPASWGALFAIRTGPADFSHVLVTKRSQGGALPDHLSQHDGSLFDEARALATAEEEDFFAALGLPTWAPWDRTTARILHFLRLSVDDKVDEIRRQQPAFNR